MRRTLAAAVVMLVVSAPGWAQPAPAERHIVIGCVTQANAKAPILLTDTRRTPPAVYRLEGDPKLFAWLVGQTVEITGTLAPAAPKQPPTLNVASVIRISTTCNTGK